MSLYFRSDLGIGLPKDEYNEIVNNMSALVLRLDSRGRIIYLNKAYEEIMGYSSADLPGKRPSFLSSHEMTTKDKDKIQVSWKELKDGWLVCADLLEAQRHKIFFEQANDAIFLLKDGVFIDCNKKTEDMFCCNRKDIVGTSPWQHSPERQPDGSKSEEAAKKKIDMAVSGKTPYFYWRHRRPDGTEFDAHVSLSRISLGNKAHLQAIVRDMTDELDAKRKLEESERNFRSFVESQTERALYRLKVDKEHPSEAEVIFVSPVICDILGIDHPYDFSEWFKNLSDPQYAMNKSIEAVENKSIFDIEFEVNHPRQKKRWIHVHSIPTLDERGEVTYYNGIIDDVTEIRASEMALRKSQARYRGLIEAIPDIVMEVDNGKNYIWANRFGLEFFGSDVVGKNAGEYIVGEEEKEKVFKAVQPLFEGYDRPIYVESWQRRKDGETRLLAWLCRTITDSQGNVVQAISTARDITEVREKEKEVERTRDELRKIINSTSEMICSVDEEGRFTGWNNSLESITGVRRKKISGLSVLNSDLPTEIRVISDFISKALLSGRSDYEELRFFDASGLERCVFSTTSMIKGPGGSTEGVVFIGRDVSGFRDVQDMILPGKGQVLTHEKDEILIEGARLFMTNDHHVLWISPDEPSSLEQRLNGCEILHPNDHENIIESVKARSGKLFILLTRADYMIAMDGMSRFMRFIYLLNSICKGTENILCIHLPASQVSKRTLNFLKDEFRLIGSEPKKVLLDDHLLDILRFVRQREMTSLSTTYKDVGKHQGVSKVTVQKRIHQLVADGLLTVEKSGRSKALRIRESARSIV